ncbi:MAG: hypothetical protein J6O00_05245 [Clostridiales bacterium]|nr:hypothetical protein [Clostridiales bacterium]
MELFVEPLFEVASYRFEWPYICCSILFVALLITRKNYEFKGVAKSFIIFVVWCLALLGVGTMRFRFDLVLVGLAHTMRMIVLFVPFLWILLSLTPYSRRTFYGVLRKYLLISLIAMFIMALFEGGISNTKTFRTVGVGKNSLGYTIVCIQILFSVYENKMLRVKPFHPCFWQTLCVLLCIFSKSGTAVAFSLFVLAWYMLKTVRTNVVGKGIIIVFVLLMGMCFLNVDVLIDLFKSLHVNKLSDFFYAFKYGGGETLGDTTDVRLKVQGDVLRDFNLDMALGRFYYYYFASHGFTAHQLYLQILYDTGIVGILLFANFSYKCVKCSSAKVAVVMIFLYSFVEVFLIQYASLIILALLVAYNSDEQSGNKYENSTSSALCV